MHSESRQEHDLRGYCALLLYMYVVIHTNVLAHDFGAAPEIKLIYIQCDREITTKILPALRQFTLLTTRLTPISHSYL